jgi:hypothetical protein
MTIRKLENQWDDQRSCKKILQDFEVDDAGGRGRRSTLGREVKRAAVEETDASSTGRQNGTAGFCSADLNS